MNTVEIKDKIAKTIDDFLISYWDGKSLDNHLLDDMARYIVNNCGDILNAPDSWLSIVERVPTREEYLKLHTDGTMYYTRLTIAYKTDTIGYDIGYYDGYKWFNERGHRFQNVIAWKPFIPVNLD